MIEKENRKVYIVEDMGVTRAALISVLSNGGFNFVGGSNKAEKAWLELADLDVAVVIIDVNLEGAKDGIWLAQKIRKSLNCAIIFLTAYGSQAILDKIHITEPEGYIMKPFNNPTLLYALKKACDNLHKKKLESKGNIDLPIMIKTRNGTTRINKSNIIYLQSEGNYVNVNTPTAIHSIRGKLDEILELLCFKNLYRIHRRYAVNSEKIQFYNKTHVRVITNEDLPYSKSFAFDELIEKIERGFQAGNSAESNMK